MSSSRTTAPMQAISESNVAATDLAVVLITAPSVDEAAAIGRTLIEEGLAACVNIVPGVRSIYRWQGKLCDDNEVLCLVKTRRERIPALIARVLTLHPNEVPEVLSLAADQVNPRYRDWVLQMTE